MKKILFILCLVFTITITVKAQLAEAFDGRWCSLGNRMLVFSAKSNKLFCSILEEHNTKEFAGFYLSQHVSDSAKYYEVNINSSDTKIFLSTTLLLKGTPATMFFVYDRSVDSTLFFVGDVYYDTTKLKYTNSNCNIDVPACSNYFFKKNDFSYISKLKSLSTISRKEVFEVLRRFKELAATKCNRCYEGFPAVYINRIIIAMGYNPVYQKEFNGELVYGTSGFDFIINTFIGSADKPKDKELSDYLKEARAEYFFGKAVHK